MKRLRAVLAVALSIALGSPASSAPVTTPRVDVELTARADVRGTLSDAGDSAVFRYAAPAGSTLSFSLSGARAMDFDVRLLDPQGASIDLTASPTFVDRGWAVRLNRFAPSAAGEHQLVVTAASAGAYRLIWTAKPGTRRVLKCDVRCTTRGRALGEESAVGRVAVAGAPTTLAAPRGTDLYRAQLDLPADALPAGTAVVLQSSPAFAPLDPTHEQLAGPAVDVQPAGAASSGAATLRLPYDRLLVPRGADAKSDLWVLRRGRDGRLARIAPSSVDATDHVVTVAVDQLARFAVAASKGPPDPTGQRFWRGRLLLHLAPDFVSDDSRARRVQVDLGLADLHADGEVLQLYDSYATSWMHDDDGAGAVSADVRSDVSRSFVWRLEGTGIRIEHDPDLLFGTVPFEASEDGSVYVGRRATDDPRTCLVDLMLRARAETLPRGTGLAGTYWVGGIEVDPRTGGDAPVELVVRRSFGTLTLDADGTWRASLDLTLMTYDPASDAIRRTTERGLRAGTWTVVGAEGGWRAGSLLLAVESDATTLRLFPSADRQLVFGGPDPATSGNAQFIVGVRRASSLSPRSLAGGWAMRGIGLELSRYAPSDPSALFVGDVALEQPDLALVFDGTTRARVLSETLAEVFRDPSAYGGVGVDVVTDEPNVRVPFALARSGRMSLRATPGVASAGAVEPRARAGFLVDVPTRGPGQVGIHLFVRLPPSE